MLNTEIAIYDSMGFIGKLRCLNKLHLFQAEKLETEFSSVPVSPFVPPLTTDILNNLPTHDYFPSPVSLDYGIGSETAAADYGTPNVADPVSVDYGLTDRTQLWSTDYRNLNAAALPSPVEENIPDGGVFSSK